MSRSCGRLDASVEDAQHCPSSTRPLDSDLVDKWRLHAAARVTAGKRVPSGLRTNLKKPCCSCRSRAKPRAMTHRMKFLRRVACAAFLLLTWPGCLLAYIGPGAGFVFVSSFLALFLALFLAAVYLLFWPFRLLLKTIFGRRATTGKKAVAKRVVVLGLDGLDPKLTGRFMDEGKLPRLLRLKQEGTFAPLATSHPSISPVAWSSFATGVDASYHNIFDFLTRDPCTYAPMLSSVDIRKASRVLPLGKYQFPLEKPLLKLKRKSQTFWSVLGANGVFSSVLRVPITFPPEKFRGVLLSGMCTPDLKGSQGTFSYFTTDCQQAKGMTGGVRHLVSRQGNRIEGMLEGPESPWHKRRKTLKTPFTISLNGSTATAQIQGQSFELLPGEYSPWVRVAFTAGLAPKIYGICRFHLIRTAPQFELYVSPLHLDPERPALPISHPFIYSVYLAKLNGLFGTLGLAEDTWALNEGVLDEAAFLEQAWLFYEERERMFLSALERTPRGLTTCVFDTPDRIQHMFFRCLDETHPANRGKEVDRYRNVIEDLYVRLDQLVGKVLDRIDNQTVVIVMSDHGFTQFQRGVNLNTWFLQHGYLKLLPGRPASGDWFEGVDWAGTRAFALGLTGVFINRKGREAHGTVTPGEELRRLKKDLIAGLTGLRDEAIGQTAILEVTDTEEDFRGPYLDDAPDLLIGYNHGYRHSWSCAMGRVAETVFEDNTRHWSGDHCVAPRLVPGVLFMNRKISVEAPKITDIAPTVIDLFGVEIPGHMRGRPLM
ncbi:MAG: alkaline phosphatase family protein [Acidobacteria bacterium]|nr:alkaline phosphatase family protein [Acidobacteriota bacterium]